jgi:hypothetical protein
VRDGRGQRGTAAREPGRDAGDHQRFGTHRQDAGEREGPPATVDRRGDQPPRTEADSDAACDG